MSVHRGVVFCSCIGLGLATTAMAIPISSFIPTLAMPKLTPYADVQVGGVGKSPQQSARYTQYKNQNFVDPRGSVNLGNMNTSGALGGDLGVQMWNFLGIEGGGFYFQNGISSVAQDVPDPPATDANQPVKYKSWVGYLAMKAKAPIMKMLDVYAKVGAGYEHQNSSLLTAGDSPSPAGVNNGAFHSWVPVFSVGLEDHLTKSLNVDLQYMHLADGWQLHNNSLDNNANKFSHKNIVTMSLGYLFRL